MRPSIAVPRWLQRIRRARGRCVPALAGALLLPAVSLAAEAPQPRLAGFYEERAREVRHLLVEEERAVLEALTDEEQKERFFERFWEARASATPRSPAARMRSNAKDAVRLSLRSQGQRDVVLIAGKPAERVVFEACESIVRRLEIWRYDRRRLERQVELSGGRTDNLPDELLLVFVQRTNLDPRSFELWDRAAGGGRLVFGQGQGVAVSELIKQAIAVGCVTPSRVAMLRRALETSPTVDELVQVVGWPEPSPWWNEEPEEVAPGYAAGFSIDPSGKFFRHTLLTGKVDLPIGALKTLDGSTIFDQVVVLGDIYRRDRLVDGFRVVHHIAGAASDGTVALDFYRRLLPGQYLLVLRVEDAAGRALLRHTGRLEVPIMEVEAEPPPRRRRDINRLTRADVVFLTTTRRLELIPPDSVPLSGPFEVNAIAVGGGIDRVRFVTPDGRIAEDTSPPYRTRLTMDGSRMRIAAMALDASGEPLAEDVLVVRRGALPLRVWFEAAAADQVAEVGDSQVLVQVPEGERLAEVRCFHNNDEVARLTSFVEAQPVRVRCPVRTSAFSSRGRLRFDRVVALLTSGEQVEDVRILSGAPEHVDVRLVELFASVLDANGRPVSDLGTADLELRLGGVEQRILQVADVARLPLSVSVMVDTSSSMGRRVRQAVRSAQRFFSDLMRPEDRASLFAFNHDLEALVDFTGESFELEYAAQGLRGRGGTRLYDGLVYNLHSFAGLPARRAMVLLSDGADTESDSNAEEVLEAARRAGVLVFPVLVGSLDEETEGRLTALARQTGGSLFRTSGVQGLDQVFRRIERILRSQVQVTFRPEEVDSATAAIDLVAVDAGLSVRNVSGYYQ